MSTAPTLNGQIIGQAERATRAVLDRLLAETGTTFPQWVALNLTATDRGAAALDDLGNLLVTGLGVTPAEASAAITGLIERGLLAGGGLTVGGQARYDEIAAGIAGIGERLYGGLPADDLATAGRVLTAVTDRARSELAAR
jgi:hypothetical protein